MGGPRPTTERSDGPLAKETVESMGILGGHAKTKLPAARFDPFLGDRGIRTIYALFVNGDWAQADEAIDQRDDAWLVLQILTATGSKIPVDTFKDWSGFAPSARSLTLMAGAQIRDAWAERGGINAGDVDTQPSDAFLAALEAAEENLWKAIDLEADHVDAWVRLLTTSRGLGRSQGEITAVFNESHKRSGFRPDACASTLQGISPKWAGNDEVMFGFARWVEGAATAGSPASQVLPMAHVEAALSAQQHGGNPEAYLAHPQVSNELCIAAEKYLVATSPQTAPALLAPLNAYVATIVPIDQRSARIVEECIRRIADRPTELPWAYWGPDIGAVYSTRRDERLTQARAF